MFGVGKYTCKYFMIVLLSSTSAAGLAYAAVQGTTGQTSTGSIDVTLSVLEELKVSNLADATMGTYVPGSGDMVQDIPFCIYYNNADQFDLELRSANSAGPGYQMANGGNFIPYTVEIQPDRIGVGGFFPHIEGNMETYSTDASGTNDNCGTLGSDNATFRATVTDTGSPLGVPNGLYTDTVTFVVTPNP